MVILVTGADGYMGWPTLLAMSRGLPEARVVGVDNFGRRAWVEEVGSASAVPIFTMEERISLARERGFGNIEFMEMDLTDYSSVVSLLSDLRPDAVVHLAAQPSAPYSQISAQKAHYSQDVNISMTRNLLWALKENDLAGSHFIETTTTGIYGAPSLTIPEGDITAVGPDGGQDRLPFPNMASSWYHVTKGFNATNMRLMNFQTSMPVSDVRTSIVWGLDTQDTKAVPGLATRFDFDFYFGTLFNRWCAMALMGEPLTVYGSGNQIKPFIHLEDAVQSLVDLVKLENPGEYTVYNQLTEYIRIRDLAGMIVDYMRASGRVARIERIPNPRVEREDAVYLYENERFLKILSNKPRLMKESIREALDSLSPHRDRIVRYKEKLLA